MSIILKVYLGLNIGQHITVMMGTKSLMETKCESVGTNSLIQDIGVVQSHSAAVSVTFHCLSFLVFNSYPEVTQYLYSLLECAIIVESNVLKSKLYSISAITM